MEGFSITAPPIPVPYLYLIHAIYLLGGLNPRTHELVWL